MSQIPIGRGMRSPEELARLKKKSIGTPGQIGTLPVRDKEREAALKKKFARKSVATSVYGDPGSRTPKGRESQYEVRGKEVTTRGRALSSAEMLKYKARKRRLVLKGKDDGIRYARLSK